MDVVEARPDRPGARVLTAVGCVLALLTALAVVLAGVEEASTIAAAPPPTPLPVTSAPGPAPGSAPPGSTPAGERPSSTRSGRAVRWELPRSGQRTGLHLGGEGDGLTVAAVDGGGKRVTRIAGYGLGRVRVVGRLGDAWLAFLGEQCFDVECPHVPLHLVRGDRATRIGEGDEAFADPDRRTVWVMGRTDLSLDPITGRSPRWVERRTATGGRVGPRTLLRRGEVLLGVTVEGPVVGSAAADDTGVSLVDPATRRRRVLVETNFGRAVAVGATLVVTTGFDCAIEYVTPACPLSTVDVRTGVTSPAVDLVQRVGTAHLDPTGRYVVAHLEEGPSPLVVDLRTRAVTPFPDIGWSWADEMAWSPDGKWLVMTHPVRDRTPPEQTIQVAIWRPGWRHVELAGTYVGEARPFVVTYER